MTPHQALHQPAADRPAPASELLQPAIPNWLERSLGGLYKAYHGAFKAAAKRVGHATHTDLGSHAPIGSMLTLDELDRRATATGNAHRGIGVLVGLLGAAIIFCAVVPVAWPLSANTVTVVGVTKVALMVGLLAILWTARRLQLKDCWIALRRTAEHRRYDRLRAALKESHSGRLADASDVRHEIDCLLVSDEEKEAAKHSDQSASQIIYHRGKLHLYESIEAFSARVTYGAFGLSFAGAAAHLAVHAEWLLFLTVYVPAMVGAMHAVNHFMRLPQLANQHARMLEWLLDMRKQLHAADSDQAYLALAQRVLMRLQRGDDDWSDIAKHQDLHPV